MSVEDATPEDFAGLEQPEPSYFRIFFGVITQEGELFYKDQTDENGPFAPDFTVYPWLKYQKGLLDASVTQGGYVSLLAAASNDDGNLVYIQEDSSETATERFDEPVDLGKPDGIQGYLDTLLVHGLSNLHNVFLTSSGPDNSVWWKYQNPNTITEETVTVVPPGTNTPIEVTAPVEVPPSQPWSDWQQLPGSLCSLTGTQNADGRIILLGVNADGVPYMNVQTSDRPLLPEHWQGWEDISGTLTGFEQLACGIGLNGLVHIFARIGSRIYMRVQQQVSAETFSDWALFASFTEPVQTMALSVGANDGLYLVAQVGSGAGSPVYSRYQMQGMTDQWSALQIIAHVAGDSVLMLQPNADTNLSLFALNRATGDASYLTQQSLAHWSASWVPLGTDISAITVTQDITVNPA
ncbi:hypothetical protein [Phycobacter sp. K97]|uniref:hypothetical protein n=1 Tax=Phycobacter sedimenti TaxID=3133977 RepID=UPI00311E112D